MWIRFGSKHVFKVKSPNNYILSLKYFKTFHKNDVAPEGFSHYLTVNVFPQPQKAQSGFS